MKLGLVFSLLTPENRMLLEAAEARGLGLEKIIDTTLAPDLEGKGLPALDLVLLRSSFSRSLYITKCFEETGVPVVNSHAVQSVCGDKALTTLALAKAHLPVPKTLLAFSTEEALEAIAQVGYPAVLKPVIGSCGRLLAKVNDEEAALAVLEHKDELGSYMHKVYYVQEYVEKPGRDIRAIVVGDEVVCAMYRKSNGNWRTNVARGASGEPCEITPELSELCLRSAAAVGGGTLGIDIFESNRGLLVNEINHAVEFKGAVAATGMDVAGKILDYALSLAHG
ncbi:Alpha-aminoadipate--LysW ligase LysX [Candidatus Burarchaeum australiense]|nr:Alpha-aminoadipate--LysW ligase LysX [Candidatus Burarchaeum australiense]